MSKKRIGDEAYGKRFGKTDLDRIGFFHDPPVAPFDEYRGPVEFRGGVVKGRQMLAGPTSKLFEKKFLRIFEGEALNVLWRMRTEQELRDRETKGKPHMIPPSPSKKHSTPGDWHGCFEKPSYFSPGVKEGLKKKKLERELPNMKIKPNPRGGPGYADICLNPFPSYSHDPYDPEMKGKADKLRKPSVGRFLSASAPLDYFPPNPYKEEKEPGSTYVRPIEVTAKFIGTGRLYIPFPKRPGGNHDGCFNKFPAYIGEPYVVLTKAEKIPQKTAFLSGGPTSRSKYTNSIIEQITRRSCNSRNYLEYQEQVYPLIK